MRRRGQLLLIVAIAAASQLLVSVTALADGWHGAAMSTKSIADWLTTAKQIIPDLDKRLQQAELTGGRDIEALKKAVAASREKKPEGAGTNMRGTLSNQQRVQLARMSTDCLDILAYMDAGNIFPNEFPDFPMKEIPTYRATAKKLLGMMGTEGTSALVGRIRAELMGGVGGDIGVRPHKDYAKDLLDSLRIAARTGGVTEKDLSDLLVAAAGRKTKGQADIAKQAFEILIKETSPAILLKISKETKDKQLKSLLAARVKQGLATAPVADLLNAIEQDDVSIKQLAQDLLDARSQAGIKYEEVKSQIPDIWELTESKDAAVAAAALHQIENAFQRAPIADCLEQAAVGKPELRKKIWEQIDIRIADARRQKGDPRLTKYREQGLLVLDNNQAPEPVRGASIELLDRLADPESVKPLIDALLKLPVSLRPQAAAVLRKVTGQKFGPLPNQGTAEAFAEQKKWVTWWQQKGGKK